MAAKASHRHPSPSIPWRTKFVLRALSVISDTSLRTDGSINRRLLNLFNFKSSPNPKPVRGVRTSDITVDSSRKLWFRLFDPVDHHNGTSLPVIVFFHGGGFATLSADALPYDLACRRFALKVPSVVVSVNYRLIPEHPYPAQHDDGFDVLKHIDENPNLLPEYADLSRTFLAGDSAGGNLAHFVTLRAAKSASDFKNLTVSGLISIQPFFGGEEVTESELRLPSAPIITRFRSEWMWKAYVPKSDMDHGAINVSGPNAIDVSCVDAFPRCLLVIGGFDPLQDWQNRYCEWLRKSGKEVEVVEYPTAIHAFYIFPELPESSLLFNEVKNFIHKKQ